MRAVVPFKKKKKKKSQILTYKEQGVTVVHRCDLFTLLLLLLLKCFRG
jgi:hypothetical protein